MKRFFVTFAAILAPIILLVATLWENRKIRLPEDLPERPFVIVIPSYNNTAYCQQNLLSVLGQEYENFRVIYIDDASTDDTYEKVQAIVALSPLKNRVTLIANKENQGSIKNLYTAIQTCTKDEIIVPVNGDDFLAHPFVLDKLNEIYADPGVWLTYGNYLDYPSYKQKPQRCQKFPRSVLLNQGFRHYKFVAMHLRSFYAGLFQKIDPAHLMKDGAFLKVAGDVAMMLPMLEMASGHFEFIDEVLYLHNQIEPRKDFAIDALNEGYIRSLTPYQPLESPPYD